MSDKKLLLEARHFIIESDISATVELVRLTNATPAQALSAWEQQLSEAFLDRDLLMLEMMARRIRLYKEYLRRVAA